MNTELMLKLTALALVDATSLGTLVIPVWFLLAPGRPRVGRVLVYLATVASAYLVLGIALMAGLMASFERLTGWLHNGAGKTLMLYVGLAMFAVGVLMPSRRADAKPGRLLRRVLRLRDRALAEEGGARALVTLAIAAVAVEAASMLPYLAAIGLMTSTPTNSGVRIVVLAGYCLVMVLPALALLGLRAALGTRVDAVLRRIGAWLERTSHENLAWALAIVGFLLARSAWTSGARLPWVRS